MILLRSIKVFGVNFAVLKEGKSPYGVLAGVEKIDHGFAVSVKGKSVMHLHPAGYSGIICLLKKDLMSVCRSDDGLTAVLAPYCRIGDTDDPFAFQPTVFRFDFMYLREYPVCVPF